MPTEIENVNPSVYRKIKERVITANEDDENIPDPFDEREIFDLIRNINHPKHPLTLEELHVVQEELITVSDKQNMVHINFTPTIPHRSMATLIGLSIRVKLLRSLPPRFKVTIEMTPGTDASEDAVNKHLADKERVAAALENKHIAAVINQCISPKE